MTSPTLVVGHDGNNGILQRDLAAGARWTEHCAFASEYFTPDHGVCRNNSAFIIGQLKESWHANLAKLHGGSWSPTARSWHRGPDLVHSLSIHSAAKLATLTASFCCDALQSAKRRVELLNDEPNASWQAGPLMLAASSGGAAAAVGQNGMQAVTFGGHLDGDTTETFLLDVGDGGGTLRAVASMREARRCSRRRCHAAVCPLLSSSGRLSPAARLQIASMSLQGSLWSIGPLWTGSRDRRLRCSEL